MNDAPNPFAAGAAYKDGRFVPMAQATVSVTDFAFTRSDSTYDVVHVTKGGFFRLDDHLDRFHASMARRRLVPRESREEIADVLHRCVALAGLQDAFVAMVALRGTPRIAGSRRLADCDNHLMAYAISWRDVLSPEVQERGGHMFVSAVPRVPDASFDPTVKNYMWGDFTTATFEAQDAGFDIALLCDAQGLVTEGPGYNVFLVKDGKIRTPAHGSLGGITRRTVLDLCAMAGIKAVATDIPRAELDDVDEVFISSTAGGIMPISRLNSRILCNDRPGPTYQRLRDLYWRKHDEGWHRTAVRYELALA